ncbi:MAG: hypothetical protein Q9163_001462 [Psora crenata]
MAPARMDSMAINTTLASSLPYTRTKKCNKTRAKHSQAEPTSPAPSPEKAGHQDAGQNSPDMPPSADTAQESNGSKSAPLAGSSISTTAQNGPPNSSEDNTSPQRFDKGSGNSNASQAAASSEQQLTPNAGGSPAVCPPQQTVTVTSQFTVTVTAGASAAANTGAGPDEQRSNAASPNAAAADAGTGSNEGNSNAEPPNTAAADTGTGSNESNSHAASPNTASADTGTSSNHGDTEAAPPNPATTQQTAKPSKKKCNKSPPSAASPTSSNGGDSNVISANPAATQQTGEPSKKKCTKPTSSAAPTEVLPTAVGGDYGNGTGGWPTLSRRAHLAAHMEEAKAK